jgi:hypothetical protein
MAHHRPFHSRAQLELSIVNPAGVTLWGKYVQAVREINTRLEGLIERTATGATLDARIAQTHDAQESTALCARRHSLQHTTSDALRELGEFVGMANALVDAMGDDMPTTLEEREAIERTEYAAQAVLRARNELARLGAVGGETFDQLRSLFERYPETLEGFEPPTLSPTTQDEASHVVMLCEAYLQQHRRQLPRYEPTAITAEDARQLVQAYAEVLQLEQPEYVAIQ